MSWKLDCIIPPLQRRRRGIYCFTSCPFKDIFRRIFLSNYGWQKSYIWSQASYKYPISWKACLDPSHSYFLFSDWVGCYAHWPYMRGYHKWALAHSSSCFKSELNMRGNILHETIKSNEHKVSDSRWNVLFMVTYLYLVNNYTNDVNICVINK